MKVLARLYRYLQRYKAWAALAFGSMIIFAVTQTTMIALAQPIFDIVLAPPAKTAVVEPAHVSREAAVKQRIVDTVLKRDLPEGRRGAVINAYDRAAVRFRIWWRVDHEQQARRVLIALIIVFLIILIWMFAALSTVEPPIVDSDIVTDADATRADARGACAWSRIASVTGLANSPLALATPTDPTAPLARPTF